jgi:hypothetical protein
MYTDEQRAEILERVVNQIIDGKSLRSICANDSTLPDRVTMLRWMNTDKDFATIIARARDLQAEALHDDMADICHKMESGELDANTGKAIIWAKQWSASKLKPRSFGDRLDIGNADGKPFSIELVKEFVPQ